MRILFIPVSVVGGYLGGFVSSKIFEGIWGMIDHEEAPEPEHRTPSWGKLLLAMAIRGAIFQATRAAIDRGSRQGFYNLTGSWPGQEVPDAE